MSSDSFTCSSDKRSEGFPVARGPFEVPTSRAALCQSWAFQVNECGGSAGIAEQTSKALTGGSWLQRYLDDLICIKIGTSKKLESILFS